jgi:hypothetical protein
MSLAEIEAHGGEVPADAVPGMSDRMRERARAHNAENPAPQRPETAEPADD